MHFCFIAFAICNLTFFVEARSIEFDFNSNIVNVRPVFPGGAGDAMAPPDYGRSFNPISTKGGDYAHQEILAPPDFQTFRRPWTTRRSLPKKDHQYDGKFLLGNAEMSISMFLREEPGAKFQRKSECFRKKSKCF